MADNVPDSLFSSIASVDFTQPTEPYNIELTELEGLGTKVLGSSDLEDENEECAQDLDSCINSLITCESTIIVLEEENDCLRNTVTPPEDETYGGMWSNTITSQSVTNYLPPSVPNPFQYSFTSNLSLEYSGGLYRFRNTNSAAPDIPGTTSATIGWRLRFTSSGVIRSLPGITAGEGTTGQSNQNLANGSWTIESQRANIQPEDGINYSEGWTTMGSFVANVGVEDKLFVSQVVVDAVGDAGC